MTYYNPKIYNYKNLKEKDRLIAAGMIYQYMVAKDAMQILKWDTATALTIASDDIQVCLISEIIEFMVSAIDSYEEEVEIVDTDDYAEGLLEDSNVRWMFAKFKDEEENDE